MTLMKILDTGYGNADATGTPLAIASRAGLNTAEDETLAFTFTAVNESMNGGGMIHSDDELKIDDALSSVSPITFSNPTIVLSCQIPRDAVPSTYKYSWLYQLTLLERTKGKKVLYLQDPAATGDFSGDRLPGFVEMYGQKYLDGAFKTILATQTGSTEGTVPYVPGFVKNVSNLTVNNKTNMLNFSITFIIDDT